MSEMRWQIGEFHTREGLTFRRNDDGTVRVRVYPGANIDAAPVLDVTLTAAEWESVQIETSWGAVHKRPADTPAPTPGARDAGAEATHG